MDSQLLLNNVEIFNGKDARTFSGNLLIRNNRIETISAASIETPSERPVTVIDGKGRFLMPGLIDAHWHAYLCCNTMTDLLAGDPSYTHLMAGREAAETLQRGFTAIRDAGGPVFGLKRAIDSGTLRGPRIYPSGAMISQTSGHGDFRMIYEHAHGGCGCEMAHVEQIGASKIADGADAVTAAVRENLRQGASQIKLMAGGGAASLYDPLDVTEFFEEELRAAVRAAEDWGTYVMVHVYNPRGIARALKAGVRSIEHGHLIDEPTMALLAESGAWLSMQAFAVEDNTYPSPVQQAKHLQIFNGTDRTYRLAKKHGVKLAWGTDLLFDPANTKKSESRDRQVAEVVHQFRNSQNGYLRQRPSAGAFRRTQPLSRQSRRYRRRCVGRSSGNRGQSARTDRSTGKSARQSPRHRQRRSRLQKHALIRNLPAAPPSAARTLSVIPHLRRRTSPKSTIRTESRCSSAKSPHGTDEPRSYPKSRRAISAQASASASAWWWRSSRYPQAAETVWS